MFPAFTAHITRPAHSSRTVVFSLVCAVALGATACTVDSKGESCGVLDVYVAEDDESYCPDAAAVDDCQTIYDAMIDAAVECVAAESPLVDRDAAREEFVQSVPSTCDTAVATSEKLDACLAYFAEPSCTPEGGVVTDPICEGVVINRR